MVSKWHDFKVVLNTLSAVIVIGAVVGTVYFYKSATAVQAGTPEIIYEKPDFEHTSNKTFLVNVFNGVKLFLLNWLFLDVI